MYSPHSPTLSSTFGDQHSFVAHQLHNPQHQHHLGAHQQQFQHHSPNSAASSSNGQPHQHNHNLSHFGSPYSASFSTTTTSSSRHMSGPNNNNTNNLLLHHHHRHAAGPPASAHHHHHLQQQKATSVQCLRFKYFTTFFVCTTCLVLLSASLATHKWLVARPTRQLRLNNGQRANFTALMLTLAADEDERPAVRHHHHHHNHQAAAQVAGQEQQQQQGTTSGQTQTTTTLGSNKFQGEIYFGLFNGVKVLNYGFGDRVSQLSVLQAYLSNSKEQPKDQQQQQPQVEPLINFKFWLVTLAGVALGILFALVGSIFAIINFVMTPRGTMSGPAGLVIWNAAACFACLLAIFAWLAEYFLRLKANVLTQEEIQNGWSSENRAQFGYSYYFVVLAFCLHLVNIFIVSIVQSETWTNNASGSKAAKRQARSACDGVIMLY